MQKNRRFLGSWELGCVVFHVCITKLFTVYPLGVSWISVLLGGLVFLAALGISLRFFRMPQGRIWNLYRWIVGIYWIIAAVTALKTGAAILQRVAYSQSPVWFLMLFLLLGALLPALYGKRAVYRLHSLLVLPIGISLLLISLFGLRQACLSNLFPLLKNDATSLLHQSVSALLFYLDIPFLLTLLPEQRKDVPTRKVVLSSAALAVGVTICISFLLCLQLSYEAQYLAPIPLSAIAKAGVGLEVVYLLSLVSSLMLYLTLALHLIAQIPFKRKQLGIASFCILLCLPLSGCYDSREVEESAYMIALGIDKGETATYRYTFQISNPLETGTTDMPKEESPPPEDTQEGNKGVNNITVDSNNLYLALSGLRSQLGKEPDLSHLKILVFSKELAREGIQEEASALLKIPKLRPDTNLCLADSSQAYLSQVKPTLEESTARYYELLFQRRYSPYAPICGLQEFLASASNSAKDAVLPIADTTRLEGLGVFHNGALVYEGNSYHAMLYQLLIGKAKNLTIEAGDSVFSLSSRTKPIVAVDKTVSPLQISVSPNLRATLLNGSLKDIPFLAAAIEEDMTAFLRETAKLSADMLGIGETARRSFLSQRNWETFQWDDQLTTASIFTKTRIKPEEKT